MKGQRFLGLAYLSPYILGLLVFTAIPFVETWLPSARADCRC